MLSRRELWNKSLRCRQAAKWLLRLLSVQLKMLLRENVLL
jgi:hypothetical protein